MKELLEIIAGQTPLHPDELEDLIPSHITKRQELNEFELVNISQAAQKYLSKNKKKWDLGDPEVLKKIHLDMFSDTWKWAGKYRKRDTNIGCDWRQIQIQVKDACDDFRYWLENKVFPPKELAVRYHHRLISIHPFPNGNGRHGRLVADIFLNQRGETPLTWGGNLTEANSHRKNYLKSMQIADQGDFSLLMKFAELH